MTDQLLGLLGLALRGGNLALGEAPVEEACVTHGAKLVLTAVDAAENSVRRAGRVAQRSQVPVVQLPVTKEELGFRLGRSSCAVLALTDVGLAATVVSRLAQGQPELFELGQSLSRTATRRGMGNKTVGRRHTPRNV